MISSFGGEIGKVIFVGYRSGNDKRYYIVSDNLTRLNDELQNYDVLPKKVVTSSEYSSLDLPVEDSLLLYDNTWGELGTLWLPNIRKDVLKMGVL